MKDRYVYIKLALLLVAAPMLIWFGALSSTVDSYVRYRRLGGEVTQAQDRSGGPVFDTLVGEDRLSDGRVMAEIEKDVTVSLFTPVKEISEAGLSQVKAEVELKGDYRSLLEVLHHLETDGRYALSEVIFERRDEREKQVKLSLTLRQLVKE